MAQSRIIELARAISENVAAIENAVVARDLPTPTFDPKESVIFPAEITVARDVVLDATQELHDLLLGPMSLIQRKSSVRPPNLKHLTEYSLHPQHNHMACMKAICRYDIVNCFDIGETRTYTELSKACGLAEQPLKHLLRHGMTMRIFAEPSKGIVAHTAASQLLRDPNCMAWLTNGVEDLWPGSVRVSLQTIFTFHV
jgi:hypothetical protein